jgi:hypothetical protein
MAAPPHFLKCPISHGLMNNPVTTSDGHSYDRQHIEEWFLRCRAQGRAPTSPLTGLPLERDSVSPNHALRAAIAAWTASEAPAEVRAASATPPASWGGGRLDLSCAGGLVCGTGVARELASALEIAASGRSAGLVGYLRAAAEQRAVTRGGASADLTAPACAALSRLALSRRDSMASHGALPALICALRAGGDDPAVAEASASALTNLWAGGGLVDADSAPPAAEVLVEVLRRHPRHAPAVIAAASALANLSAIGGADAAAHAGAVPAACNALRCVALVNPLAAAALMQLLSNLVGGGEAACAALADSGGLRVALEAARAHSGNARVSLSALRLIRNAAQYVAGGRISLAQLGAVSFITSAMRAAPSSPAVAEAGAQAVANLLACAAADEARYDPAAAGAAMLASDALAAGALDVLGNAVALAQPLRRLGGELSELQLAAAAAISRVIIGCALSAQGSALLRARLARQACACGTRPQLEALQSSLPPDLAAEVAAALAALRACL